MSGGRKANDVTRVLLFRYLDWPVIAAEEDLTQPVAIVANNRIVACSPTARMAGVITGLRKREAQGRCPSVQLCAQDIQRDRRIFEPFVETLQAVTPRVEILEPGLVLFPVQGPSRYFGGEQRLAEEVLSRVKNTAERLGLEHSGCLAAVIADGAFTAQIAVRAEGLQSNIVILAAGSSRSYLAKKPVGCLADVVDGDSGDRDLVDVLKRLGLKTLGAWAAIPTKDVSGRFGSVGLQTHRLACGLDRYPPNLLQPVVELAVKAEFEPPAETVSQCIATVELLAKELVDSLRSAGLTCTRLAIEAESENGATLRRLWRQTGRELTPDVLVDRVRWQLDSWLYEKEEKRPRSGILTLVVLPEGIVPAVGRQLTFWCSGEEQYQKLGVVTSRIRSIVGMDEVKVVKPVGGVSPASKVELTTLNEAKLGEDDLMSTSEAKSWPKAPWPGQIPAPSPAQVFVDPLPVDLLGRHGSLLKVDAKGELSSEPYVMEMGAATLPIVAWAGPWLEEFGWWDKKQYRRRARLQLISRPGIAYLVCLEHQRWRVEGIYD